MNTTYGYSDYTVKTTARHYPSRNVRAVFNHPRFAAPDTNPASSTFGQAAKTELNQARVVQMSLKLYF